VNTIFPEPEEGKEGSINLSYVFVNKRPHMRNMLSPNQGYGIEFSFKHANSSIFGVFDYTKTEIDIYGNGKLGPFAIYGRSRYEIMGGTPPSQESLGIFDIPNYYLMGTATPGREYMSPRGYKGSPRFGTRAYMGTLELRAPVLPLSLVEVLKVFKLGSPTVALISDFGNAWTNQIDEKDIILTTGYEFRMAFNFANVPILIFSYGLAQEQSMWSDGIDPEPYFQMTLVNPF
tara:strand:- start:192 stop:887 length:696 start_codon:yes stop_codon:yes gene_type:complete